MRKSQKGTVWQEAEMDFASLFSKKAAAISCMLIRSSEDAVARCASVFNW
jgi:hypothetical protein